MKPLISDVSNGSVNINVHPASTADWPHEPEAAGASWKECFAANLNYLRRRKKVLPAVCLKGSRGTSCLF